MQVEIYEDKDHAREDEIAALGGQGGGQNYFTSFYERFKEVREVAHMAMGLFFPLLFRGECLRM
jgi:hypothetical protein